MMKALLFSFLFISQAISGTGTHGGDAIVCYDQALYETNGSINREAKIIKSPLLKDYWEHSQLSFFKLDLEGKTYKSILRNVLDRLETHHPQLALNLKNSYNNLKKKMKFISRSVISQIDDSNSSILPDELDYCYDRQVAFQFKSPLVGQALFYIDKNIFQKMDEKNKAGLILHELLIEEFKRALKTTNLDLRPSAQREFNSTDGVRYLNYIISSDFMTNHFDFFDYISILKSTHAISMNKLSEHIIKLKNYEFQINGRSLLNFKFDFLDIRFISTDHQFSLLNFDGQSFKDILIKRNDSLVINFEKRVFTLNRNDSREIIIK